MFLFFKNLIAFRIESFTSTQLFEFFLNKMNKVELVQFTFFLQNVLIDENYLCI